MKYTVSELLAIAIGELGYKEKETNASLDDKTANAGDGNWTKYARDLHAKGYYQANKNGYAWCDMFVDWCFLQLCGGNADVAQAMTCQTGPYGAGCKFSAQYYRDQGRFYASGGKAGDQIFFQNYAHTGVVEKIEGGIVHTIEGNTSNMVARRKYNINSSSIDGYGRPKYDEEAEIPEVDEDVEVITPGTPCEGTDADEKKIWDFLSGKGLNDYAVAGIMGNLFAESGLRSDNLENTGNTAWSITDEVYTEQVDAGTRNFVDGKGYGLAQWTYFTRKRDLLAFAKEKGVSICDWQMQMEFLWKELQNYTAVMNVLKAATSIQEASDIFMAKFENPKDQSQKRKNERAGFGQNYFDEFAEIEEKDEVQVHAPPTEPVAPVVPEAPAVTAPDPDLDVGEYADFAGGFHYTNAWAATGKPVKASRVIVTQKSKSGQHRFHCRAVNAAGKYIGGCYGWVDGSALTPEEKTKEFAENAKVTISADALYGGLSKKYRGKKVPFFVYGNSRKHTIVSLATHYGEQEAHLKEINSWVPVKYLTVVN